MKKVTLDKTTLTIDEKTSGYINITNGNGGYSVTKNNTNVSVYANGSTGYRVYGEKAGSSILSIKDSAGKVVSVSVVVRENIKNLVVTGFNQSRSGVEGEIINFTTTSGNGNYTITSSNTNVASVSINSTLGNGSITLKTPGSTTITLKDGKAKSVSMNISVKQKYDIKLGVIYDVKSTSNKGVGGLQFKVSGNNLGIISEIGVQFTNSNGIIEKQPLKIQQDGIYMVAYSNDSCKGCSNFKPYYTIGGSTNIANANDSGENEENDYIEEEYVYEGENEEIEETPKEDGQVEIASATYGADFSGMIYILWFWKSLFSYKQKVVDIKDKYGEGASILISLIPLVGEGYDILTLLGMKDPITGEKLTKLTVGLTIIGLMSGVGSGSAARKAGEEMLEKISKDVGLGIDEITRIATNYFNGLEFSTVDGLINNAKYFKVDNFKSSVNTSAWAAKSSGLITKFSKITNGDDIISVANTVKVTEKIGNGGTAIMIKGGKEVGDSIKDKLIKDGWKKSFDSNVTGKGYLTTLEKGKEKINIRDFDSSGTTGNYPGYTHQKTVEILKYDSENARIYKQKEISSQEIKFILPTN